MELLVLCFHPIPVLGPKFGHSPSLAMPSADLLQAALLLRSLASYSGKTGFYAAWDEVSVLDKVILLWQIYTY